MNVKLNIGLIILLMSVISSFLGNGVWFSWWVYFLLSCFEIKINKGNSQ